MLLQPESTGSDAVRHGSAASGDATAVRSNGAGPMNGNAEEAGAQRGKETVVRQWSETQE